MSEPHRTEDESRRWRLATPGATDQAIVPTWEQRFRAPTIYHSQIAIDAPTVGLVATNVSGIAQLYRWDVEMGELARLTEEPTGRCSAC